MNVLSFSTHLLWPSHLETELELIQQHLDAGDAVTQVACDACLPVCDPNPRHRRVVCARCVTKRREGRKLLTRPIGTLPLLPPRPADEGEGGPPGTEFASAEELKSLCVENFDLGYGIASSLVSLLRNPRIDVGEHRGLIAGYLRSALAVYRSVQRILETTPVDRVYVFNPRFAQTRAILRACQSRGVECFAHDRGHDIRHYELFRNVLPHDLERFDREIRQAWARAAERPDREAVAAAFFQDRAQGRIQSWYSFTREQRRELLPEGWRPHLRNIVIFNSSEDEFAALGNDWRNPLYPDQIDAVGKILASFERAGAGAVHLTLRMHPNNRTMARSELERWYRLRSPLLTVVPPDAPVDSYALLRRADTVLTFGSTVGIEAVYWGRPSILAGWSDYRSLGGTYRPASHAELIDLLRRPLEPQDRLPALMYGYFMNTFGTPFRHYEAAGVGSGRYRGRDLNKVRASPLVLGRLLLAERGGRRP